MPSTDHARRALVAFAVSITCALVLATQPAAASKYVSIKGAPAPGPSKYDRVFIDKQGPKKAKTVLVLIPGTGGGSGSVAPVGHELTKDVKGLQVWGFDRREQAFEDTSGFDSGDPQAAADYYLGFKFQRTLGADVPFVRRLGLRDRDETTSHRVIEKASRHGRRVILGGHSRGASSAVAYAAWDFKRDGAGYKDLDGLVLIDGGLAAFGPQDFSLADARAGLNEIREGAYFNDPLGAGIPEIGQIFAEVAALYAVQQPDAASPLQDNPLVAGAGLAPPFPVTNEGFLGYIFDKTYSPLGGSLQIRAGDFGTGDPRPWVRRREHPDRGLRQGLLARARQRDRVVLPEAVDPRHRRRQRAEADAGRGLPRLAPLSRPPDRRSALRLPDRAHGWRGAEGRADGDRRLEDQAQQARRRVKWHQPSRSGPGPGEDESLRADGDAVPEGDRPARIALAGHLRPICRCEQRSSRLRDGPSKIVSVTLITSFRGRRVVTS